MKLVLKDGIAISFEDGVITHANGYEVNNLDEFIKSFVEDAMIKSLYPDLNSIAEMQKIIDGLKREIDFLKVNYVSKRELSNLTNNVLGRL